MRNTYIVFIVILGSCQASLAGEIAEPLYCVVQELESISIATNSTKSVDIKKINPKKPIKVVYKPKQDGYIIEIYGKNSKIEQVSEFSKAYSAGGTQYLSLTNPNHAITYFGKNKEGYHVVMKFMRFQRNDGGRNSGWRTDSYINVFMYCADRSKLKPANK